MAWPLARKRVTPHRKAYRVNGEERLCWWIETTDANNVWIDLTPGEGFRTKAEAVREAKRIAQEEGAEYLGVKTP